ncbi:hypothetical protein RchiOBHm_Chr4g0404431 [Rosa chinensis]|uniref:Uncharacterized protein n=1 Tax=Rosa chinensis TaxID=74649 RepID=A0A2P6QTU0_ROSCH|nr:hypothetical protein RchiOBHm_Chr4g0404431 [Rosa chinensis]
MHLPSPCIKIIPLKGVERKLLVCVPSGIREFTCNSSTTKSVNPLSLIRHQSSIELVHKEPLL